MTSPLISGQFRRPPPTANARLGSAVEHGSTGYGAERRRSGPRADAITNALAFTAGGSVPSSVSARGGVLLNVRGGTNLLVPHVADGPSRRSDASAVMAGVDQTVRSAARHYGTARLTAPVWDLSGHAAKVTAVALNRSATGRYRPMGPAGPIMWNPAVVRRWVMNERRAAAAFPPISDSVDG